MRILTVLAGLRKLEDVVLEEATHMPVIIDIMQNRVLGPAIRKALKQGRKQGREEGVKEGREEGRQEGVKDGELNLLTRQLEKRFGPLPPWAKRSLAAKSGSELEELSVTIDEATSLKNLLK